MRTPEMTDLEAMLRRRQDELRGWPETRWEKFREHLPYRDTIAGIVIPIAIIALLVVMEFAVFAMISAAFARDLDGRYVGSELKPWFDSLKSGKGPCCSDADGTAISDADWRTKDGRYQVRLDVSRVAPKVDMQWIDVPEDAVITEPNRAGKTMVWPIYGYMGTTIRCFMPGALM